MLYLCSYVMCIRPVPKSVRIIMAGADSRFFSIDEVPVGREFVFREAPLNRFRVLRKPTVRDDNARAEVEEVATGDIKYFSIYQFVIPV